MASEKYSKTFLQTADIIAAFFTEIYYNYLHKKSKDHLAEGKHNSLTDAYRNNVLRYTYGIASRSNYLQVVQSMHSYYQRHTRFSTLVFSEFEDKILSQFVPAEYYCDFTEKNKDTLLQEIITRVVKELEDSILSKTLLRMVVDMRGDASVVMMRDRIVDILVAIREKFYAGFARRLINGPPKKRRDTNMDAKCKELSTAIEKLKSVLVEETRKRCKAEQDRDKYTALLKSVVAEYQALRTTLAEKQREAPVPNTVIDAKKETKAPPRQVEEVDYDKLYADACAGDDSSSQSNTLGEWIDIDPKDESVWM